jgi:hypothetical protein
MPVGNFLVGGVLRSPMHRVMSQSLLLLTFQGHRTGKDYTFPVAYTRFGPDELVVLAGRPEGKTWWTYLEKRPRAAKAMGVMPGPDGEFPREGLAALAAKVPVVSIRLRTGGQALS